LAVGVACFLSMRRIVEPLADQRGIGCHWRHQCRRLDRHRLAFIGGAETGRLSQELCRRSALHRKRYQPDEIARSLRCGAEEFTPAKKTIVLVPIDQSRHVVTTFYWA